MAVSAGSPTVSDVKGKLQGVLVELEKYRDLYRTTSQELELEKEGRTKVINRFQLLGLPPLPKAVFDLTESREREKFIYHVRTQQIHIQGRQW